MESICASFADGGKQGAFIREVPVGGRPRNTQLFAELALGKRVNPFPRDQFEAALDQRGQKIAVMVGGHRFLLNHKANIAQS